MGERHLVVDHLKFSYEGLFSSAELYSVISGWFFDKGWDWWEKMNEEHITPEGRQMRLVLTPWKSATDYYKIMMRIKLHMINVQEVEIEKKGKKLKLDHGVIRITFDGYVMADRHDLWKNKPFKWFISVLLDKYFFHFHFAKLQRWIESDVDDLHHKIKDYLNVFKYTYQ